MIVCAEVFLTSHPPVCWYYSLSLVLSIVLDSDEKAIIALYRNTVCTKLAETLRMSWWLDTTSADNCYSTDITKLALCGAAVVWGADWTLAAAEHNTGRMLEAIGMRMCGQWTKTRWTDDQSINRYQSAGRVLGHFRHTDRARSLTTFVLIRRQQCKQVTLAPR